jgi:hypothetical protein
MTSAAARFLRNPVVEIAPLKEEMVLFHPGTNKFCLLNKTMSFIWTQAAKAATAEEIGEQICSSFANAPADRVRADVDAAIGQMMELDLLVAQTGDV